jgi:Putative metallopeptidase
MRSKPLLIGAGLCMVSSVVAAQSFLPQYGPVRSPQLASLQRDLKQGQALEQMAAALSEGVRLPKPLVLGTAECGAPNAFYSRQHGAIVMCLDLIEHLGNGISRDFGRISTPQEVNQAVSGAFIFVLFHELGHALIDQLRLPVLGREEDAADQIGAFFILRTPNSSQALAGALWFFKQRTLFYTRQHFAGEHSLGPQRQTNLACWAYGSDPSKYSYLLNGPFLPKQRAVRCAEEYAQLDSAVRRLLEPHVELPKLR